MAEPDYPFVPRSNAYLRAGQFWAVSLGDRRFACGRVMAPRSRIAPRAGFVAGLMDWVGEEPPTAAAISGCKVLDQGHANIKTIVHTGGALLGCRDLDEDGLVADPDPDSTYGYQFIERLAKHALGPP